ncbi:MAG: hypothetical protein RL885_11585 [Planctomycetota bacterium]
MKTYIVLTQNFVTVGGNHEIVWSSDLKRFEKRKDAVSHGFEIGRCDDFNVGTIESDRLVAVGYMESDCEGCFDVAAIAKELGL